MFSTRKDPGWFAGSTGQESEGPGGRRTLSRSSEHWTWWGNEDGVAHLFMCLLTELLLWACIYWGPAMRIGSIMEREKGPSKDTYLTNTHGRGPQFFTSFAVLIHFPRISIPLPSWHRDAEQGSPEFFQLTGNAHHKWGIPGLPARLAWSE